MGWLNKLCARLGAIFESSRRPRKPVRRGLKIEPLESRQMLTVGAELFDAGLLKSTGDDFPGTMSLTINGQHYYVYDDGFHGRELWTSDGTSAGTRLVADFSADPDPTSFLALNGYGSRAVVSLTGQTWITDGTTTGTIRLVNASSPHVWTHNGQLFLATTSGLFRSDGTSAGTVLISSVVHSNAGPADQAAVSFGSHLYFSGKTGSTNVGLWRTDGVSTTLVRELAAAPTQLAATPNGIMFAAGETSGDRELWKSDGTSLGTVLVRDIVTGPTGSIQPTSVAGVVNGRYVFAADDGITGNELWVSDGTSAGTQLLYETGSGAFGSNFTSVALLQDTLFLGPGVYRTDGTPAGTSRLATGVSDLIVSGNKLYFVGTDSGGSELWSSNGTSSGTQIVRDIAPGITGGVFSFPDWKVEGTSNGLLYYLANDQVGGYELWKTTDGSSAGTALVADYNSSAAVEMAAVGSATLLFTPAGASQWNLWRSEGASKTLLKSFSSSYAPNNLTLFNNQLYFAANDGTTGVEVWKSDGTSSGTILLKDINSFFDTNPVGLTVFDGNLYFGETGGVANALWKSDGTNAGTTLVANLSAGADHISSLAVAANTLFIESGSRLWKSDGTSAGTLLLANFTFPIQSDLVSFNNRVYFVANSSSFGDELWTSDGTSAGTTQFVDLFPGVFPGSPFNFEVINGQLYFAGKSGSGTNKLFRTDGTTAGTQLVRDFDPPSTKDAITYLKFSTNLPASEFVELNGLFYFVANNSGSGFELWRSDGTSAGTFLLRDIAPGANSSRPSALVNWNGRLFFTADDSVHGRELWTTDGTSSGTVMVADLVPGAASSNPSALEVSQGDLFFAQNDTGLGPRLFRLTAAAFPTIGFSVTSFATVGESGTYTIVLATPTPVAYDTVLSLARTGSASTLDYSLSSTTVLFPAGSSTAAVALTVLGDAVDETDETIQFSLETLQGLVYPAANPVFTVTITDDDTSVIQFASSSLSVGEAAGTTVVFVTLSTPSASLIQVPLTHGGSASPADASVSALNIAAGQTSAAITISVVNDNLREPDEALIVSLGTPSSGQIGATASFRLDIANDDPLPLVQFMSLGQSVIETIGARQIAVRMLNPSSLDVTIPVAINGTASGTDHTINTTLPLVIPAGQISTTIDVSILDDLTAELTETVVFTLGNPINGIRGAVHTHTLSILDNDTPIEAQFAVGTMNVAEAGGSFPVFVTLTTFAPVDVTVPLTFSGSATSADYAVSNASVTIPAGQTRGTFSIRVTDDQLDELTETIVVSLGTPSGAAVGSPNALTITIDDNDPIVGFARGADTVADTSGTVTVVAQTVSPVVEAISIPFTLFGNASNSADYTLSANQFDFVPGASTAAITITINGDSLVEPLEFVTLRLTPPAHASLGPNQFYTLFLADANSPTATGLDLNGPAPGQDHLTPAAEFVEDASAVTLVPAATVVPPGVQTLTSITAFLELAPNGSTESLAATNFGGATVTPYSPSTRTLTISGGSTSDQQAVLRSLTYQNSSQNPTAGGRFVSITATFSASSETRRRKLTVTPQNDAPTVTLTGGATNYVTGNAAVAIDGGTTIGDVDSTLFTRVVVTLTDAESGDLLSYTPRPGLSYSLNGNTLAISGLASGSYFAGALQLVRFSTTTVGDGARTVSIAATDLGSVAGVPNATTTVNKALTVQSPLLLAESSVVGVPVNEQITLAQLQPLVTEALARWEAVGLEATQLAVLQAATIEIRDLGDDRTLGLGGGSTIVLDDNAAGVGWFVDTTPTTDDDVALATQRVDLLTAIMHEYGHLLGLDDMSAAVDELMASTLPTAVRRRPRAGPWV